MDEWFNFDKNDYCRNNQYKILKLAFCYHILVIIGLQITEPICNS